MEKRIVIAIVLSAVVMFAFNKLSTKPTAPVMENSQQQSLLPSEGAVNAIPSEAQNTLTKVSTNSYNNIEEKKTEVILGNLSLIFSNIGGTLENVEFLEGDYGDKKEPLISEKLPLDSRIFSIKTEIDPTLGLKKFKEVKKENSLTYSYTEAGKFEIIKVYNFDKVNDTIGLSVIVKNLSNKSLAFPYSIVGPSGLKEVGTLRGRNFVLANSLVDGKVWKAKEAKKGFQERVGEIGWTAMKNRYYAMALKPFSGVKSVGLKQLAKGLFITFFNKTIYNITPGSQVEDNYFFYCGELNNKKLTELGYDLNLLVDYGFFGPLSKVLISALNFIYNFTKNWGVAIILLTILINIILFPLTFKSFSSMHQMKKIQPHMQKLKELHKDNPQRLNKEMMELYREYKVNPIGGCLPMLLQMPIFIALYQGLMKFTGLKGANFLWVKNLSNPDAVPLPFTLPLIGNHINVLPLLMVGVMVVQQKISQGASAAEMTEEQIGQQKMMMLMMPIFFGFLFYGMPSALVLYWLTNSVLMTIEQGFIGRRASGR